MKPVHVVTAVVVALAAAAVWTVVLSAGHPGSPDAHPVVSSGDAGGRPSPLVPPVLSRPPVERLEGPESPAPEPKRPSREADARVADGVMARLVRRLQEIEARRPADFHHGAMVELLPFLEPDGSSTGSTDAEGRRAARLEELRDIADAWQLSPRVRGAVLALLGAWAGTDEVLPRMPSGGEAWRSAILGLGCEWSVAGEPSPVRVEIGDYTGIAPGNLPLLPFDPSRAPDRALEVALVDQASRLADTESGWCDRVTAILALGPAIDSRAGVLELMSRLLADDSPWGAQVHHPVGYVMALARSDAARERLLRFLEEREAGDDIGRLVRYWMGGQPALPGELGVLAAPLLDPRSTQQDRLMSAGSLLQRAAVIGPEQAPLLEDVIAQALARETDDTVRLTLVATLASNPTGRGAVVALERVLLSDARRSQRIVAARGLGAVGLEHAAAARAALLSARSIVTEAGILEAVEEALAALP